MLTGAANEANGGAPRTVMWSIAEIARRDGVSKPTVSIHVKKLAENHGLTVQRDPQGRVVKVNVAEYDHLRGRTGDPSKAQAPSRAGLDAPRDPSESYDEAIRQKTWLEAEKRRIELAQMRGQLVPVEKVIAAVSRCAEDIVLVLDRLPNLTDDLVVAFTKEGAHGLRVALKQAASRLRGEIADALRGVALAAPAEEAQEDEA